MTAHIRPIFFRPVDSYAVAGISKTTLYRWIKEGHLKPIKRGRITLIRTDEIERYLNSLGDAVGDAKA